jgi:hypothetical protein
MCTYRGQIAAKVAARFLSRAFAPGETLAILLRRNSPAATVQRMALLERALQPRYLGWLAHENAAGANVYVAANPLIVGSRKRTKESMAAVRHLYLDLDSDGNSKLDALRSLNSVPIPTAIVSTSAGKYQVLWRVEGFSFAQQERMLKLLAMRSVATQLPRIDSYPEVLFGASHRVYFDTPPLKGYWRGTLVPRCELIQPANVSAIAFLTRSQSSLQGTGQLEHLWEHIPNEARVTRNA